MGFRLINFTAFILTLATTLTIYADEINDFIEQPLSTVKDTKVPPNNNFNTTPPPSVNLIYQPPTEIQKKYANPLPDELSPEEKADKIRNKYGKPENAYQAPYGNNQGNAYSTPFCYDVYDASQRKRVKKCQDGVDR